jgi:hypothetical protein
MPFAKLCHLKYAIRKLKKLPGTIIKHCHKKTCN